MIGSSAAIRIGALLCDDGRAADVRGARIILTAENRLVPTFSADVFIADGNNEPPPPGCHYTHADIVAALGVETLAKLGVYPIDPLRQLELEIRKGLDNRTPQAWDEFWKLCCPYQSSPMPSVVRPT